MEVVGVVQVTLFANGKLDVTAQGPHGLVGVKMLADAASALAGKGLAASAEAGPGIQVATPEQSKILVG